MYQYETGFQQGSQATLSRCIEIVEKAENPYSRNYLGFAKHYAVERFRQQIIKALKEE